MHSLLHSTLRALCSAGSRHNTGNLKYTMFNDSHTGALFDHINEGAVRGLQTGLVYIGLHIVRFTECTFSTQHYQMYYI